MLPSKSSGYLHKDDCRLWKIEIHAGLSEADEAPPRSQELAGWRSHGTDRSDSERQSPRVGVWGREEAIARAERSGAGAFLLSPLGGSEGRQGAASV